MRRGTIERDEDVEVEVTSERDGKDYRGGRNVDNAEFMETFGISGITYGNWVNRAARQAKLNATYDALLDLAFVLGIPARAISLNGSLGVQFGASGKGKAKAHYRPNDVSINLTRDKGDGSLAHEWWHALDHYFMRQHAEHSLTMTSDVAEKFAPQVMNAEAAQNFLALMRAFRSGSYYSRAKLYDETTNGRGYWDGIVEMSARAFQCYVAEKVREGGLNDYLSSYMGKEEFARMDAAFEEGMNESRYPYPTAEELKELRPLFDKFFSSLTHKEGEGGNLVTFSDEVDEVDEVDDISMQPGESEAHFAERVSIMNRAKANGTWLKAPNGKDSKLNPQQWTLVRTQAFSDRFGNWESFAYQSYFRKHLVELLSPENMKKVSGKTYAEIQKMEFDKRVKPIAYIPVELVNLLGENVQDNLIYSSDFRFVEHVANHRKEVSDYATYVDEMLAAFSSPDAVYHDTKKNSYLFARGEKTYFLSIVSAPGNQERFIQWKTAYRSHELTGSRYELIWNKKLKKPVDAESHDKGLTHNEPPSAQLSDLGSKRTILEVVREVKTKIDMRLDENDEPMLDDTISTLSTYSLALDDAALDGMPDLQEEVVQDLLGAVRREIARLNRVFTGSNGSDVAARELGQIAALMKQVYRRCDKKHRAAVLPRVRVVDALGKMLRNGRVYSDALTDEELEGLKQQMQDEEGLLAGGFAVEESVDDAGNVTLRRAGSLNNVGVREVRKINLLCSLNIGGEMELTSHQLGNFLPGIRFFWGGGGRSLQANEE